MAGRLVSTVLLGVWVVACARPESAEAIAQSAPPAPLVPGDVAAFFDCLRTRGFTVTAAHRGGPGPGFAENAIETFAHTIAQVPAVLEIDIARTRDGALVLMHDDTLDRTTTGTGEVRARTLAEIRELRLEDEAGAVLTARVPTLREALDWSAGRAVFELDVKRGVAYEDVVTQVRAAGAMSRVIFITYSTAAAIRVHALAPEMMLSVSVASPADLEALAQAGVDLTRVLAWTGTETVNAELNRALAARGVEAMFGTLGNPARSWDGRFVREGRERYEEFARAGLQLIATDRPVPAARQLDAHDGVPGHAAYGCLAR